MAAGLDERMTPQLLAFIRECITKDDMLHFYKLKVWIVKRREVLALDHGECQHCKRRGKHVPAKYVHHVHHVKDRPELALSIWCTDENGKAMRQLISLCHECHEAEHGHRVKEAKEPLTLERW